MRGITQSFSVIPTAVHRIIRRYSVRFRELFCFRLSQKRFLFVKFHCERRSVNSFVYRYLSSRQVSERRGRRIYRVEYFIVYIFYFRLNEYIGRVCRFGCIHYYGRCRICKTVFVVSRRYFFGYGRRFLVFRHDKRHHFLSFSLQCRIIVH